MVVALYVVALAMVVAGIAVIADGYPVIVIERGWAQVIAGTVTASAGFILFGIAAVVSRLGRVETALRAAPSALPSALPRPEAVKARAGMGPLQPPEPAAGLAAAGTTAGVLSGAGAEKGRPETKPGAEEPSVPITDEGVREVSIVETAPSAGAGAAASAPAPPEASPDRDGRGERAGGPGDREGRDKDSAAPASGRPPEAARPARPPAVVGKYSSGGNSYVMFADGSIEAETPNGSFRFTSLDELKEFIASGGEGGAPA
jgi:hypothetical protein